MGTLLNAPPYDPGRERRRRGVVITIVLVVALVAMLAWRYRNWPEERTVDRFFAALQHKDYDTAYGIWFYDPDWKQHPQQHAKYPLNEFMQDWGPGGEWGIIQSYHVDGAESPKGGSSGVVVVVTVNGRAEKARVWVEKSDKTLTFSPY
jgi:hypothetical protein